MPRLTDEIKAELRGKSPDERRADLTEFHQQGFDVESFLLEMLVEEGAHSNPEDEGFKKMTFASDKLVTYVLNDNKTTFFFQETDDGSYRHWPLGYRF